MGSEAPLTFLIYLREDMRHFSSNVYLLLQHIIYFPCSEGTPNLVLCVQFESQPQQKLQGATHKRLANAFRSSHNLSSTSKEVCERSDCERNPCRISYPFLGREATPNMVFCVQFESLLQQK